MNLGFSKSAKPRWPVAGMMLLQDAPPHVIAQAKRDLTFVNPAYKQALQTKGSFGPKPEDIDPEIRVWRETNCGLMVPRHYYVAGLEAFGQPELVFPLAGDFVHTMAWEPREEQLEICAQLNGLRRDVGMLLPCGFGKSFLALWYAAKFTGRILVVCPNNNKLKEWRAAIPQIMGIDPGMVGHVQAGTRDWEAKPISLAMLKTLSLQDFPPEFLNGFSVVIWDEAHLCTAPMIGRAMGRVNGVQVALTATPGENVRRKILELNVGNLWLRAHAHRRPMVAYFVRLQVPKRMRDKPWSQQVNAIAREPSYSHYASGVVKSMMKQGRRVLVLNRLIQPLLQVHNDLNQTGGFVVGEASVRWLADSASMRVAADLQAVGSHGTISDRMGRYMAKVKAEMNPILATGLTKTQPGGTGMDVPDLDGGVLMFPVGNKDMAEQIKGRLDRDCPTKQDPVMVVMVPDTPAGVEMGGVMQQNLRLLGVKVIEHKEIPG